MKTITTALIAATLAITSFTATAVDRFTRFDNGYNYTPVCKTAESMIDFMNADRANDLKTMALIYRQECSKTSQGELEFEILGSNRYISKVVFYDASCRLGSTEYYIDNSYIYNKSPEQMKFLGHKPPKCSQTHTSVQTAPTQTLSTLNDDPANFIICMTLQQVKELAGMQDGWPKGCFAGAPSSKAVIKSINGPFAEVVFQLDDGTWSDTYWLGKDNFNK